MALLLSVFFELNLSNVSPPLDELFTKIVEILTSDPVVNPPAIFGSGSGMTRNNRIISLIMCLLDQEQERGDK